MCVVHNLLRHTGDTSEDEKTAMTALAQRSKVIVDVVDT